MRITLRHYYNFARDRNVVGNDTTNPGSWDALRVSTSGPSYMVQTREALALAASRQAGIAARARAIDSVLRGSCRVASYGVGGALLEWWLRSMAGTLTERARATSQAFVAGPQEDR